MNWNSGAGSPSRFQCSACRKFNSGFEWPEGSAKRVELTGRERPTPHPMHQRSSRTTREYACGDCGHTGWSNHKDLEQKAAPDAE